MIDNDIENTSKFISKVTQNYNDKIKNNFNWFGIYAFYKGLYPKNAQALYWLKVDKNSAGDTHLLNFEARWDINQVSIIFYLIGLPLIILSTGAVVYMLFNLENMYALNIILSVIFALLTDVVIIRNILIILMSIFVHVWARYKNYFISSTNLPREKEAEEIFDEMMNEPEPAKESEKDTENKFEEEE